MRTPHTTGVLLREKARFVVIEGRIWKWYSVGFEDSELVTHQRMQAHVEARHDKGMDSPLELVQGTQA